MAGGKRRLNSYLDGNIYVACIPVWSRFSSTLHLGSLYVVVPILALNLRNAGNSDYITSKVDSQLIGILLNCYFF